MQLSHNTVYSVAELAKLDLTHDEIIEYAQQLSHILSYFEILQQVDTSHIEATASVLSMTNVLRVDVAGSPLSPMDAVKNAPETEEDQFRVNAVLPE